MLDGGAGTDTIIFNVTFGDAHYARGPNGATLFSGPEGTDIVLNHEALAFNDLSITFNTTAFGATDTGAGSHGGMLIELFDGILQRAPNRGALEFYADALEGGATLGAIAQDLLTSSEYSAKNGPVGQETNQGFVNEIYQVALGRAPDSGSQGFVDALNAGASRGAVAASIATSAENQGQVQDQLSAGVFVPNADASVAARLYLGVLDRPADAAGLASVTSALEGGAAASTLAQTFLNSMEYGSKFGVQTNDQFVAALYDHAVGHDPDAGGAFWVNALNSSATRADVAVGITQSAEAQAYLSLPIEQGWLIA